MIQKILGAVKVTRVLKNWPVYFKDYLGFYKNKRVVYNLRGGLKFIIRGGTTDRNSFNDIFLYNEYGDINQEIKSNHDIIDIGSNIGIFTIYAASKSKEGNVYSFEPFKENFQILKENVELNNLKNVKLFNSAVLDKEGHKDLIISKEMVGHSFYLKKEHQGKTKVKTVSLKRVIEENKIEKVDFLKVDCEGSEYDILFNCPKSILNKIKKIAMEVHNIDKKRNINVMADFLKNGGFDIKIKPVGEGIFHNLVYAVRK